jgi:hypothetical protein
VKIMWMRRSLVGSGLAVALVSVFLAGPARGQEEGAGTKVERSLESAADATKRGLQRAGEATGNAIGTAIDKTGQGIGTAIDKTGQGLQRAGEALSGSAPRPTALPEAPTLRESDLPPEGTALEGSAYDGTEATVERYPDTVPEPPADGPIE